MSSIIAAHPYDLDSRVRNGKVPALHLYQCQRQCQCQTIRNSPVLSRRGQASLHSTYHHSKK
jgi:hypothetical protein